MNQHHFPDTPAVSDKVLVLPNGHPAMLENRTVHPTSVVQVKATTPDHLLVSGENNRHIGAAVATGAFAGYSLYTLTLEERATCPSTCYLRAACSGNGMSTAQRHKVGDAEIFFARLEEEIKSLTAQNRGVMIRLHDLGDFFSVEYVAFWLDILATYPNAACYGSTARLPTMMDGDEIGDAIESVKAQFPDRFRIRWSFAEILEDGVSVTTSPEDQITDDDIAGVICPADTRSDSCCAVCGLCWSSDDNCILFLKKERAVETPAAEERILPSLLPAAAPASIRSVEAIEINAKILPAPIGVAPEIRLIDPRTLLIEDRYQRSLTSKSKKLIEKIVGEWNWSRFKPPICSETAEGLFVIDGQHTAIAAVTHGGIFEIPILVTKTETVEQRASAFVAHNRDRVAMTVFDIFHGELASTTPEAVVIDILVKKSGCTIPRSQPLKSYAKIGQITAVNELRAIHRACGDAILARILAIAYAAQLAPVTALPLRALRRMITNQAAYPWQTSYTDVMIAAAMRSIPGLDLAARDHAAKTGQDAQRACIMLVKNALEKGIIG